MCLRRRRCSALIESVHAHRQSNGNTAGCWMHRAEIAFRPVQSRSFRTSPWYLRFLSLQENTPPYYLPLADSVATYRDHHSGSGSVSGNVLQRMSHHTAVFYHHHHQHRIRFEGSVRFSAVYVRKDDGSFVNSDVSS